SVLENNRIVCYYLPELGILILVSSPICGGRERIKQMPKAAYLTAGVESGFVRGDEDLSLHPLHRHHEVELKLAEQGIVTYLFVGNYISLQPGQIVVFWAAIPHHIAMMETDAKLHWLCLPMGQMLYWDLPAPLPQQILDGAFVLDHWGACPHFD